MELILFLFAPPVIAFVVLALLPAGQPAALGLGCFAVFMIVMAFAIYPLGPSSGPDDWFHGIEQVPFWASVLVGFAVGLAQLWRFFRLRSGKKPYYVLTLVGMSVAATLLFLSTIWR